MKDHYSELQNITADKSGYVYIYCSNESPVDVFFDNLQIVHTRGPVLEENHYYPYGLQIAALSIKAAGALQNGYLYQGAFSEYDEESAYHEFFLRQYDAQIGRWTTTDPYEQFASPYLGMGNRPMSMVDPSGGGAKAVVIPTPPPAPFQLLPFLIDIASTAAPWVGMALERERAPFTWYVDKNNKVLLHTNDGSNDVVMVPDNFVSDFNFWAGYQEKDINKVLDSKPWNDNYKQKFGLSARQLSADGIAWLGTLNSDWSRTNAVEYQLNPTFWNGMKFSGSEALSQWTNPYLVVGGASVAVGGLSSLRAGKARTQFTKSNLKLGQEMHKAYHAGEVGKEFRLLSGKRIDFLDIKNSTIYELKPFNPRAMQQGQRQLNMYLKELQSPAMLQKYPEFKGINWKTVLDTY